ncbi:hypothetical protein KCP75_22870 [Salmonella enterica subsp. enterica]|nr:hypothetical protein KCP75_22870 [Salmonella enterica subsp. enterica]
MTIKTRTLNLRASGPPSAIFVDRAACSQCGKTVLILCAGSRPCCRRVKR